MDWIVTENLHVIPRGDLREHEATLQCFCKPRQDDESLDVFTHNSLDQREKYETGELKAH